MEIKEVKTAKKVGDFGLRNDNNPIARVSKGYARLCEIEKN